MEKTPIRTERAPAAVGPYSQGIVVDGWLYSAGQVALDPLSGSLVGADAATQAERALRNLGAILERAGAGFEQVVRVTVYLTSMGDFKAVNEVYATFFREPYPARACVEVTGLPLGALVEIDVVARVG